LILETHRNCGGTIINKVCDRCGKKWNKISYYLSGKDFDMITKSDFDANEYRRRIRSGRDITSDK
jgi:hypothetical protein